MTRAAKRYATGVRRLQRRAMPMLLVGGREPNMRRVAGRSATATETRERLYPDPVIAVTARVRSPLMAQRGFRNTRQPAHGVTRTQRFLRKGRVIVLHP